jgi:hypothetical protein
VTSRNRLYQILVMEVALGVGQRAKTALSPVPVPLRWEPRGGIATANFREFFF